MRETRSWLQPRLMISDDMVREILARVDDVAALLRCATTCKAWRRLLVANTTFFHRCLSAKARCSSPFLGFVALLKCARGPVAPCFFPAPTRPVLGLGHHFLDYFLSADPGVLDNAVPLASRHGLLLLRLTSVQRRTGVHLAVCNLLAGTFQVLPSLEGLNLDRLERTGYALLTTADCCSSNDDQHQQPLTSSFKVLVIDVTEYTMVYRLRTYSSTGETRWKMCSGTSTENLRSGISPAFWQPNAVMCNGVAHWLLWGKSNLYTLQVSAKTGHVAYTMLPHSLWDLYFQVGYDYPYLSVDTEEERLMLIYQDKEHLRLEYWTWNDNEKRTIARVVKLKQPDLQNNEKVQYKFIGEKNGTVLLMANYERVYVVDFKTEVMQELTHWPHDYRSLIQSDLGCKTFIPVEMDWPAYFVSRLCIAK